MATAHADADADARPATGRLVRGGRPRETVPAPARTHLNHGCVIGRVRKYKAVWQACAQGREQGVVRDVARGEHQRLFLAMQRGQLRCVLASSAGPRALTTMSHLAIRPRRAGARNAGRAAAAATHYLRAPRGAGCYQQCCACHQRLPRTGRRPAWWISPGQNRRRAATVLARRALAATRGAPWARERTGSPGPRPGAATCPDSRCCTRP